MSYVRRTLCGTVISAGRMMRAVKVRTAKQVYNSFLRKHFQTYEEHLVSDPNNSLRAGDTVRIASGWPTSRHIKHVVIEILAPWGPAIDERPPVLTEAERVKIQEEKRARKLERRRVREEGGGAEAEAVEGEGEGNNQGKGEGKEGVKVVRRKRKPGSS